MVEQTQRRRSDTGKSRHVSVMVPWRLFEEIVILADQEGRTFSQMLVRAAEEGMKQLG